MKKANPKAVGGFVIAAAALAVASVVIFGGGQFFEAKRTYVAYFPGSLAGLRVGAPVTLRGIQIGTVTEIWVEADLDALDFQIPVIMEIEQDRVRNMAEIEEHAPRDYTLPKLIDRGLRAQLSAESLVTGQLAVVLNIIPDSELVMVETTIPYPQIPTVPSELDELKGTFDDLVESGTSLLLDVQDLLSDENKASVAETLTRLASITRQVDENISKLDPVLTDIRDTVQSYEELAQDLDAVVEENRTGIKRAVDVVGTTGTDYGKLAQRLDALVVEISPGIEKTINGLSDVEQKLNALIDTTTAMIEENRDGIRDFSNGGLYEINNLAVDAQGAVEQFRRVMEEMERDPARFFLGEPGQVEVE